MPLVGLLVVALLVPSSSTPPPAPSPKDSIAIVDSVRALDSTFVWSWRFTWEASEGLRHALNGGPLTTKDFLTPTGRPGLEGSILVSGRWGIRLPLLHCHFDGSALTLYQVDEYVIKSGAGKRGICPSWYPFVDRQPPDERLGIDAGIVSLFRGGIRDARDTLLAALDHAGSLLPGDPWIVGQRVRFALDQADTARALTAATTCAAPHWWCHALEGYVRYGRGEVVRADALFASAVREMPPAQRCTWTDLGMLLDDVGRAAYRKIACDRRDQINAKIWWLADPLYSEPVNERRVEHDARQVLISIRSVITPSERYDWRDARGGRAVREMLVRYGWPAFSAWAGRDEDHSHYLYLGTADSATLDGGLFTTNEYTMPRAHTVPAWTAIVDPFHAPSTAWTVSMDPDRIIDRADSSWWPAEHYARPEGPLLQLAEQTVLLRRDDHALMALAADLPADAMLRHQRQPVTGVLALSTGPDSIQFHPITGLAGTTVVAQLAIPLRPQLASLEFLSSLAGAASVRTRLGVAPPPSLSSMRPGELAISEPVITRPAASGELPPTDPAEVLPLMYGSTSFRSSRVGIYWETYGVGPRDTVDVVVSVDKPGDTPPGLLRRLLGHIGMGTESAAGVSVSWRETPATRRVTMIPGVVPIQGRSINLGMGQLAPGPYVVSVSVARVGKFPVTASRAFTILAADSVR